MMPFGENVVSMMPKDNNRKNELELLHQYGVFAGIVPRTGEFIVPTIHRLSEDKRWDAEFVSRMKEMPWDFKSKRGRWN